MFSTSAEFVNVNINFEIAFARSPFSIMNCL